MPNWCCNKLSVYADDCQAQFDKFREISINPDACEFTFNGVVPMPPELLNSKALSEEESQLYKEQFGYDNWYDWAIANWGCKWDASEAEIFVDNDHHLELAFDTPWEPPTAWFSKVCEMFPELNITLRYEKEGMGFFGRMRNLNGKFED